MLKKPNEDVKALIINIISNIIFQLIILAVSSSGILYFLHEKYKDLSNNKITISLLELIILLVMFAVSTLIVLSLIKKLIKRNRKNKESNNIFNDIKDYYFSDYKKQVTIYNNGTGIIIHKFTIVVNDVKRLKQIRRKLNIEDGAKTSKFPPLESMKKTNMSERFKDFGFWYDSKEGIIMNVDEFYWDNKSTVENKKLKKNPQELRWIFKINSNKLVQNQSYEICYVISVPGLSALKNGKLDVQLLNDPLDLNSSSNMHIDHKIQNLTYIISFENGVSLNTQPQCQYKINEQDELKTVDIQGKEEYDLLYTKYIFNIKEPAFGSNISINWKYNTL